MTMNELKVIDGGATERKPLEKGSKQWADRIRKEAKVLAAALDTTYMQLAEKLWMIYDTPIDGDPKMGSVCLRWKDAEGVFYASFDRYVEAELGIHYKRATRLRQIWKILKIDLALSEIQLQRVIRLGQSKVRELCRPGVLTPENADAWIDRAEASTVIEVSAAVTKYLSDKLVTAVTAKAEEDFELEQAYNGSLAGTPTSTSARSQMPASQDDSAGDEQHIKDIEVRSKLFNCRLFDDQIETVDLALKRSAALSGSDKIGHNLTLICTDFVMTNDFKYDSEEQRLRFLVKLEKLTGFKMILVDPAANEVIYGIATLEKLAQNS